MLRETGAKTFEDPVAECLRLAVGPPCPGADETEKTVAPDLGGKAMGVNLDRIGRHVITDHYRGTSLPHPQLVPDSELGQVGLGLRPPNMQKMARVVEDVAIGFDAPTDPSRLGLALEHRSVDAGSRQSLRGHEAGQSPAHNQCLHLASISTRPSQMRIANTITATTDVTITVAIGSR